MFDFFFVLFFGDQEKDSLAFAKATINCAETLCQACKESLTLSKTINNDYDLQDKALRKPFKQQDQNRWIRGALKWCNLGFHAGTNLLYFYFSGNLCCQITCMLMDNNKLGACVPPLVPEILNHPNYTERESCVQSVSVFSWQKSIMFKVFKAVE